VETATARASTVREVLRYSGTIQGTRRVPLSTKMMGTVTQLDVEEGDRVSKGEVLIRVRSQNVQAQKRQIQARLQEAKAAFDNAKTNFERIKALYQKDSATEKEFDDAKTGSERAQARVEALEGQLDEIEQTLDYATVRAPIDGSVVEKRSKDGTVLLRWVRTGKRYGDRVEILSGLSEGETYVVNGEQWLLDGQAVESRS